MKTKGSNGGLGDARSGRRKSKNGVRQRAKTKNFNKTDWIGRRDAFFRSNVRVAAAARSFRIALDVTQGELAEHFGVHQTSVGSWESGKYAWQGGHDELEEYMNACRKIAGVAVVKIAKAA